MNYKDRAGRNLREIAKALGVAHVVEGQRPTRRWKGARKCAVNRRLETMPTFGPNTTTATCSMFSRFKARSRNKSPVNCEQSFRRKRKRRSTSDIPTADLKAYALYSGRRERLGCGTMSRKNLLRKSGAAPRTGTGDRTATRSLPWPGARWQNYKTDLGWNFENQERCISRPPKKRRRPRRNHDPTWGSRTWRWLTIINPSLPSVSALTKNSASRGGPAK